MNREERSLSPALSEDVRGSERNCANRIVEEATRNPKPGKSRREWKRKLEQPRLLRYELSRTHTRTHSYSFQPSLPSLRRIQQEPDAPAGQALATYIASKTERSEKSSTKPHSSRAQMSQCVALGLVGQSSPFTNKSINPLDAYMRPKPSTALCCHALMMFIPLRWPVRPL